ncbi:hypothetical protein ACGFWG_31805 [Streptomyces sp. NPDC048405]|uniref:hypothetical protein n=1 Tax=Streptomyces TaxID=1883 RepID=UPI001C956BA9|nr:hypothetical protein [Streptomyces salinarius]WST99136.1 hypothetical protein OG368_00510 [Streptomyces sp. NBC_01124]WSU05804.1 hypothetical protein OG368_36425 [Streptomyces sp. NBC_01124]
MGTVNKEIEEFIRYVVEDGSNYRMDEMDKLYAADMAILFPSKDGSIVAAPREDVFAEFAARGSNGERALSTEYRILHLEEQGDDATVLLYRRMSESAAPFLYELRLKRGGVRGWLVAGETVTPWPDPETAGAFLPPRQTV